MSADTIVAKSPSIIYKPGGVSAGLVVTTWAEVQQFIAFRQGTVYVYVDDSIVSPALVPGASGVTECDGRVELRAFSGDSLIFTVLQVEPGATLQDLFALTGIELRCNAQTPVPSVAWTPLTPNGGTLYMSDFAVLSNAATSTAPGIALTGGKGLFIELNPSSIFLNAPAQPLISVGAGSSLSVFAYGTTTLSDNFATGAGGVSITYDNQTAAFFAKPYVAPALPGITGGYVHTNADTSPQVVAAIVYKPGTPSTDEQVATWAEVQTFIQAYVTAPILKPGATGKIIVYVDDSVVSPAPVPGATGITECFGRVVFRPASQNPTAGVTLQIQNGATIRNPSEFRGQIIVDCLCTSATPSIDFDYVANSGCNVTDGATIQSNAASTNPALVVPATKTLIVLVEGLSALNILGATALVSLAAATSNFFPTLLGGSFIAGSSVTGAGTLSLEYDVASGSQFVTPGTPPAFPGVGTYVTISLAYPIAFEMTFLANAADVFAALKASKRLPAAGTLLVDVEGYGGSGGGGGGQSGGAAPGAGGGGSGGCILQRALIAVNLAHRTDVIVGSGGLAGAGGVAGNGTAGGDGTRSLVLDFVTSIILTTLAGSSGGAGGGPGQGHGGASYPGPVLVPKITDIAAPTYGSGFLLAGGIGGLQAASGSNGQNGLQSNLVPDLTGFWAGGLGGATAAGQGGGGGGGGAGVLAPGGAGGTGQPGGSPGGNGGGAAPNSGGGVGGGAGGTNAGDNGGNGSVGATGILKMRFVAP